MITYRYCLTKTLCLEKKIADIFDPTKNNSYISIGNEARKKLADALKPFIPSPPKQQEP